MAVGVAFCYPSIIPMARNGLYDSFSDYSQPLTLAHKWEETLITGQTSTTQAINCKKMRGRILESWQASCAGRRSQIDPAGRLEKYGLEISPKVVFQTGLENSVTKFKCTGASESYQHAPYSHTCNVVS